MHEYSISAESRPGTSSRQAAALAADRAREATPWDRRREVLPRGEHATCANARACVCTPVHACAHVPCVNLAIFTVTYWMRSVRERTCVRVHTRARVRARAGHEPPQPPDASDCAACANARACVRTPVRACVRVRCVNPRSSSSSRTWWS